MIYSLNGKLIYSDPSAAVVECGGVGYKCQISLKTVAALPKVGEQVFLYTYLSVREDAVDLFGFATMEENPNLGQRGGRQGGTCRSFGIYARLSVRLYCRGGSQGADRRRRGRSQAGTAHGAGTEG